jgi:cupin 2 domain-containing protein
MGHEPAPLTGGNLLADLPADRAAELFEPILTMPGVRMERIVSFGQATPPGEWYDQEGDEWVLLLSGSAGLLIEGEPAVRVLKPGDYLMLPANCRHRVEWTEQNRDTVWLAIHFPPDIFRETGGDHAVLGRKEKKAARNPA